MQLVSPHHGTKRRSDRRAAHQEGWPICRLYARGAGHSALIASKLSGTGRLICLDQDDWALNNAKERLSGYGDKVVTVKTNFRDLEQVLKELPFVPQKDGVPQVDGILFDLGYPLRSLMKGNAASATTMTPRWICGWTSRHS